MSPNLSSRQLSVLTRVCAVFSEASVHGDTVGFEVLAEQLLATTAVETLAAKLRVVCNDTVANVEALDLRAHGRDDTDSLMACRKNIRT